MVLTFCKNLLVNFVEAKDTLNSNNDDECPHLSQNLFFCEAICTSIFEFKIRRNLLFVKIVHVGVVRVDIKFQVYGKSGTI